MQCISSLRQHAQSLTVALLLLLCATAACADTYSGGVLTMPSLAIGSATYSNVVVNVGNIVSGPTGSFPYGPTGIAADGTVDSYDPGTNELTVQSVRSGGTTYYNVVVTVNSLVSIGSVNGADAYDGTLLTIPSVQVPDGSVYSNVVITIGGILSWGGGMPANIRDVYDPATQELTIAAVQYGSTVYTNVIVAVGNIVSAGEGAGSLSVGPPSMQFFCHFGVGPPSGCTQPERVTLTNNGNTPVYVIGATISADGAFFATNLCPEALFPGQSCAVVVSFEGCEMFYEKKQATCSGVLSVRDSVSGGPQTVMLGGMETID